MTKWPHDILPHRLYTGCIHDSTLPVVDNYYYPSSPIFDTNSIDWVYFGVQKPTNYCKVGGVKESAGCYRGLAVQTSYNPWRVSICIAVFSCIAFHENSLVLQFLLLHECIHRKLTHRPIFSGFGFVDHIEGQKDRSYGSFKSKQKKQKGASIRHTIATTNHSTLAREQ